MAARRYESDTFVAQTMTRACEWLEDNYRDGPFFLYTDTFDPHEPWDAPPWYVERYNPGYTGQVVDYPRYARVKGYLSPEELNHCRALYAAEVTLVDRWTGRLLQKISDLNLLDDTLVLFTTDHGFLLGEHGIIGKGILPEPGQLKYIPLYEEISHIPFIIHVPGGTAGRRTAVVQPQDIMPTLLELAHVPIPRTVNGRSFAGVVRGGPDRHRDFAVSVPFIGMETVFATVWKDRWAAMLRPGKRPAGAKHADKAIDGYAKTERAAGLEGELLFDMAADPQQERNLAREHPGVMAELRADLLRYFESARADKKFIEAWRKPPPLR